MDEPAPPPSPAPTAYDRLPYHGLSCLHTHPAHLAAVATLHGLSPPPVERARVLELGSGTGDNLLSIAASLPHAHLLGVDLSSRQVAHSAARAEALGLRHVAFRHLDLRDLPPDAGPFDYILVHGLYSWVAEPVRRAILQLCRDHLSPDGLAFVSYNARPGGYFTAMLRDLLLFHARDAHGDADRGAAADEALRLLQLGAGSRTTPLLAALSAYAQRYTADLLQPGPLRDGALHHDLLGEVNQSFYFHEFAAAAAAHGLSFVAEAAPDVAPLGGLPDESRAILQRRAQDPLAQQQYLDFLSLRPFRQSVLRRADPAAPAPELLPGRLLHLQVASRLRPAPTPPGEPAPAVFTGPRGLALEVPDPLARAALSVLAEAWPGALPLLQVVRAARRRLGLPARTRDPLRGAEPLCQLLLQAAYGEQDLVHVRTHAPAAVGPGRVYPVASALSRLQARSQPLVTNLYHENVALPALSRWVLARLTGERDRDQIVAEMFALVQAGQLEIEVGGHGLQDPRRLDTILRRELEECLQDLAHQALLVP